MKRTRGEDGAALVLALVVVLVTAVLGLAVANLTTTSVSFSNASASDRQLSYAADGAADWAINQVAQALNAPPSDPPPPLPCASPEPFPGFTATTLTVSCQAPRGGDRRGNGGSQATYVFTVTDAVAQVTYLNTTVAFAPGGDGLLHGVVQSWAERPTR
ncbi:MAG TPA: hypothetical protein VFA84_11345 [Acidimicrobiales bacterium]|nr:hypothetical protein [Acidimicrobiales bacterium]